MALKKANRCFLFTQEGQKQKEAFHQPRGLDTVWSENRMGNNSKWKAFTELKINDHVLRAPRIHAYLILAEASFGLTPGSISQKHFFVKAVIFWHWKKLITSGLIQEKANFTHVNNVMSPSSQKEWNKKHKKDSTRPSKRVKSIFIRNEIQNTVMQQDEGQQVNKTPIIPYPHPNPRKAPI